MKRDCMAYILCVKKGCCLRKFIMEFRLQKFLGFFEGKDRYLISKAHIIGLEDALQKL